MTQKEEKEKLTMIYAENRKLFTVAEVSHACGISRATLIRLEDCGFLTPFRVDPDTGYRYYDSYNIMEIGRYMRLQVIGLTRSEITDFYHERIDTQQFIAKQQQKLNILQHFVNELELRYDQKKYIHSFLTLPDMTCYCEDISSPSFKITELSALTIYENIIAGEFRVIPNQAPVVISDNWSAVTRASPDGCRLTVCIPVIPTSRQSQDTHLRSFPGSRAFSTSTFGGYSVVPELFSKHFEELAKRELEPDGPARLIVLATNTSTPDEFIFEYMVPIKQ